MGPGLLTIPVITIQHDFPEVIKDIKNEVCLAEDIWISCYTLISGTTTKSVHGKVRVTSNTDHQQTGKYLDHLPISLQGRDGIECEWADHASYSQLAIIVTCESLSIPPTLVSFPSQILNGVQPNGIECMDLAGDWIVTGGKNGKLCVDRWSKPESSTSDIGHENRIGKGHVSDLTSCQFFPSGKVILTTSIDMSARIYSLDDGINSEGRTKIMMNPRTLGPPHGRGVIAAGIMGKGKEIVTGCRDGKLRIWNVGEAKVVTEASWPGESSDDLLTIKIGEKRFLDQMGERVPSIENHSRLFLLLGLSSGALQFVDLPNLKPIPLDKSAPIHSSAAIEALAVSSSSDIIAYGTRTGIVCLATLDWRRSSSSCGSSSSEITEEENLSVAVTPLATWQRTSAAISSLAFSDDDKALLVATADGLPYQISVASQPRLLCELAGYNCDPLSAIRSSLLDHKVFAAGKDGNVLVWDLLPSRLTQPPL